MSSILTFGNNESTIRSRRSELISNISEHRAPELGLLLPKKRNKSALLQVYQEAEEEDKEDQMEPPDKIINETSSFRFSSGENTCEEGPQQARRPLKKKAETPTMAASKS